MDEVHAYNRRRWEALVEVRALFTKPWLDLDEQAARERIDEWHVLGDVAGRDVLCLAGGGGQQSVAFALLGARVTVLDISPGQLERDIEAADHYGVEIATVEGDMRDLCAFGQGSFDLVWQPYSLNFVPDCRLVFRQVARVLRLGGLYHFAAANPFAAGMGTDDWSGEGYVVRRQYVDGAEITYQDEDWVFREVPGARGRIDGPREYRQTLGRILNGLVDHGFLVARVQETASHEPVLDAEPGEWEHFATFLPPWIWFWTVYRPDVLPAAAWQDASPPVKDEG
jgi:ubiquinone/menaquinone biosynthesis C-methylase UbiE